MSETTPLRRVEDHSEELRAADGRVPGRRGRATRQRLLACTLDMLTSTSYRDVKVIDIAREAGTSPATFYQYFADVEAATLVLAEEMAQHGQHLRVIITEGSWVEGEAMATALELVDAFLAFWDDHRSVLRVVDLATDEGDGRFQKIRVRLLNDITTALAEVVRQAQKAGRIPKTIDPMAAAGVLVAMLAHTAAHQYGFEFWGIRTAKLRQSMARQVSWGVTGIIPPD
ncbi:MAG: TetR/AcrR family transcriptional regulator [Acidimicrobiia bacterium]|nr:TetR/AcrR family transcriptional regulator [Acidimicrobiia bacterium]